VDIFEKSRHDESILSVACLLGLIDATKKGKEHQSIVMFAELFRKLQVEVATRSALYLDKTAVHEVNSWVVGKNHGLD